MPNVIRAALAQQGSHGKGDPVGEIVFDQLAWRFGVKLSQTLRRLVKASEYLIYARINCRKILCPTLCMAGEDEAEITLKLARECYEQLPHPASKLVILTREEGGAAHCQVDNLDLLNGIIFDWLDEVFARQP
jgi:pimeloyl-ACP methyl ester carboxylesterase